MGVLEPDNHSTVHSDSPAQELMTLCLIPVICNNADIQYSKH